MRKTAYRPRKAYDSSVEGVEMKERDEGGEMAAGVVEAEKVEPDYEGGRRLMKAFREVWLEMVGVLGMGGVVCGVAGWLGMRWILERW